MNLCLEEPSHPSLQPCINSRMFQKGKHPLNLTRLEGPSLEFWTFDEKAIGWNFGIIIFVFHQEPIENPRINQVDWKLCYFTISSYIFLPNNLFSSVPPLKEKYVFRKWNFCLVCLEVELFQHEDSWCFRGHCILAHHQGHSQKVL